MTKETHEDLLGELGVPGYATTEQFARSMKHARAGIASDRGDCAKAYGAITLSDDRLMKPRNMEMTTAQHALLDLDLRQVNLLLVVSASEMDVVKRALKALAENDDDPVLQSLIKRFAS
jgi:hypothetical protein